MSDTEDETAPGDLEELAREREREANRRFSAEDLLADEHRRKIRVRTFAGPESFVGRMDRIRVAHLTDLHVGRVTPMDIQRGAIALANAESPDLVVLTGDYVCHSLDYLDALEDLMRSFTAPAFAVLGNHDHWSGGAEVRAALKRAGVTVLDNATTEIEIRGSKLQILGIDDAYTSHADRKKALAGVDPKRPTLGLSHIAEEADALWAGGVELVLSGHTHGGQVTLAGLHELAIGRVAGHKYVHGLYGSRKAEPNKGAVYVGAGIGSAVMPIRLGERGKREVTIFDLGVGPGTFEEHHEEQAALPGRKPSTKKIQKRALAVLKKRQRREKKQG
ncbi:MAG: metallophosphoesterase [Myxococcota bacterium]